MIISNNSVVTIDYTLKSSDGSVLEESGNEPLTFLQGSGILVPGLEKALEGKSAGFELDITLPPEEAFGERDEELVLTVEMDDFENPEDVTVGLNFQAEIGDAVRYCTVQAINEDEVLIDANHPFCGQTLQFWLKVTDIREATAEELEHGHSHHNSGHGCDCGHECGCH